MSEINTLITFFILPQTFTRSNFRSLSKLQPTRSDEFWNTKFQFTTKIY